MSIIFPNFPYRNAIVFHFFHAKKTTAVFFFCSSFVFVQIKSKKIVFRFFTKTFAEQK